MYQNKRQIEARENTRAFVSVSLMLIGFIWLGASVTSMARPLLTAQAHTHLDPEQ